MGNNQRTHLTFTYELHVHIHGCDHSHTDSHTRIHTHIKTHIQNQKKILLKFKMFNFVFSDQFHRIQFIKSYQIQLSIQITGCMQEH